MHYVTPDIVFYVQKNPKAKSKRKKNVSELNGVGSKRRDEQAMHYDVSEYKNYGASRKNGLQKGGQNVKINFSFYLLSSRALLKFLPFTAVGVRIFLENHFSNEDNPCIWRLI